RHVGFFAGKEGIDRALIREIELATRAQQQRDAGFALIAAHERATHHALVARNVDLHANGVFDVAGSAATCASRFANSRSCSTMIFTNSLKRTFGSQPSCLR